MSWQEVGAFLGALIALLVTVSAFAFNYLRRDSTHLAKAQADIAGITHDLSSVGKSIDRLERLINEVSDAGQARADKLDSKMEKMTDLLIRAVGERRARTGGGGA